MDQFHLDAIVAPTAGPAWLTDWVDGDHRLRRQLKHAAAVAGYPDITVRRRVRLWPARRNLILRPRLERTHAPENRLQLRANDSGKKAPAIFANAQDVSELLPKRLPLECCPPGYETS